MKIKQKRNKLGTFITTLLIISVAAPLVSYAFAQQIAGQGEPAGTGNYPQVPGIPDNAVQYNKTETTPNAEMAQVAAGEPALFQYRNMTMLMNCTQNCSAIFTADPEVTPKVLGISVEPNQTMTLTMNMYGSPLQGEQVMERTLNFYLGIEPDAEIQLQAQLRLLINQTELNQELNREVNVSKLTWMYWNQTRAQWTTVESFMDQNGYLVCNTNHFSTWTVAEVGDTTEPPSDTTQGEIPLEYFAIGAAVIVIVVIAAASALVYKKRK
jgi:hypothetical protein